MHSTPVVILCGGKGIRMGGPNPTVPKPLVEIGGMPILWHVMQIYLAQGFSSFILCLGEQGGLVERAISSLVTATRSEVDVSFVATGADTPSGGRVAQIAERVSAGTFFLTYADGIADVDLAALYAFHHQSGGLGSLTTVRPHSPWGHVKLAKEGRIERFVEKPPLDEWINGGFFCLESGVLERFEIDSVLERRPLESLASDGELYGYRHHGFWACMDTYKDVLTLNRIWDEGEAPWRQLATA